MENNNSFFSCNWGGYYALHDTYNASNAHFAWGGTGNILRVLKPGLFIVLLWSFTKSAIESRGVELHQNCTPVAMITTPIDVIAVVVGAVSVLQCFTYFMSFQVFLWEFWELCHDCW